MANGEPAETGSKLQEEEEDERFGSSTGLGKLRGRLGSLSPPSMPSALRPASGYSPTVITSFLLVGILIAFITMCMLSVIVGRLRARKAYPSLCVSNDCLEEAAIVLDSVNRSANPCDNFYQYACGNFPSLHPPSSFWDMEDAWSMLDTQNQEFLEQTLASGIVHPDSAEEKAKIFYSDCINEYEKTDMGGKPLINAINNPTGGLGGWFALYTFKVNNWANPNVINGAIQTAHSKYAIAPFFTIDVAPDYTNKPKGHPPEQWTIEFNIAKLALRDWMDYVNPTSPSAKKHIAAYRNLISTVVQLLWKDDGNLQPPQANQLLQTVINDVLFMETHIANITHNTVPDYDNAYKTLGYMNQNCGGLSYFPNTGISASTTVHLHEEDYLCRIAKFLNSLTHDTATKANAPRMLNNYIIWSIARQYITDLGWEYVHANRIWAMAKYDGWVYFTGQQKWCVIEMERNLRYLLSGIYVMDHFNENYLKKASDVFDYLRNALVSRVDGYGWMDSSAKAKAKLKLNNLQKMVGYPSWLGDMNQVSSYYQKLNIVKGSTFSNIVEVTKFSQIEDEQLIIHHIVDKTQWPTGIYSGDVQMKMTSNTLYLPAGFLQRPFFDGKVPQYMNFASMGRFTGGLMTGDIDYWGCHYDENGYSQDWWPKSTNDNFNSQIKNCQMNLFVNQSYAEEILSSGKAAGNPMPHPLTFAQVSWRDVAALNIAYDAYKAYISDNGKELGLPGFQSESTDQAFFTAFAQTWCESADPLLVWYYYSWWYQPIGENLVNTVMQQMPQFRTAFSCPTTSPMGTPKHCSGF